TGGHSGGCGNGHILALEVAGPAAVGPALAVNPPPSSRERRPRRGRAQTHGRWCRRGGTPRRRPAPPSPATRPPRTRPAAPSPPAPVPRARPDPASSASITTPDNSRAQTFRQVAGLSKRSTETTRGPIATANPIAPST